MAWFSAPPVRANCTLATPAGPLARAPRSVVPLTVAPAEGRPTDVVGTGLLIVT